MYNDAWPCWGLVVWGLDTPSTWMRESWWGGCSMSPDCASLAAFDPTSDNSLLTQSSPTLYFIMTLGVSSSWLRPRTSRRRCRRSRHHPRHPRQTWGNTYPLMGGMCMPRRLPPFHTPCGTGRRAPAACWWTAPQNTKGQIPACLSEMQSHA